MYAIFAYTGVVWGANVGIYGIQHGASGYRPMGHPRPIHLNQLFVEFSQCPFGFFTHFTGENALLMGDLKTLGIAFFPLDLRYKRKWQTRLDPMYIVPGGFFEPRKTPQNATHGPGPSKDQNPRLRIW